VTGSIGQCQVYAGRGQGPRRNPSRCVDGPPRTNFFILKRCPPNICPFNLYVPSGFTNMPELCATTLAQTPRASRCLESSCGTKRKLCCEMNTIVESMCCVEKASVLPIDLKGQENVDNEKPSSRGGLLTLRLRPCSVPRINLARHHRIRMEYPRSFPRLAGIPAWLKPFLSQYNQMGCREEQLCSTYRHLPLDLMSEIRSACTAVVILSLRRLKHAAEAAKRRQLDPDAPMPMESDQWLHEGLSLSDTELETYDEAEFGIVR
jgi:hypothetical protein